MAVAHTPIIYHTVITLPSQQSPCRRSRPSASHRLQRGLVGTWKRVTRSLFRARPGRRASVLPGDFVMLGAARRRSVLHAA